MSSPRGGGGSGIGWGFWHFLKKIIKIPIPGQRIIVKISRNKWFTSHLLFKIDRSNAWCQVKIPTLGDMCHGQIPVGCPTPPPPNSGLTLIGALHCISQGFPENCLICWAIEVNLTSLHHITNFICSFYTSSYRAQRENIRSKWYILTAITVSTWPGAECFCFIGRTQTILKCKQTCKLSVDLMEHELAIGILIHTAKTIFYSMCG